ncbi:MAG: hypothetical protein NDI69_04195 [Bacteriovoracaceae bacterium]|nr:hypothetical protein [Bacteriovoracaceae bacterium]
MNSRFTYISRTFLVTCLLGLSVACQDTLPNRQTITKSSAADDELVCPEGQEVVSETVDGEVLENCQDIPPTRPTGAVFWKTDFCACKDSKPVSYGNCSATCAGRNTGGAETLFANFRVTEAISLGGLGNMYAWCKVNLPGDEQNPECEIEARDEQGNISYIEVIIPANSNSLQANIQDKLSYDKAYVLTLVEKSTGAKSDSIQFVKYSSELPLPVLGPLKNIPISQYTCLIRPAEYDSNTNDAYYNTAYRQHFYFMPRLPPDPLPPGTDGIVCHDIFNPLYGMVDDPLYPRLETIPGIFNLWDDTDPRFYDNNGNGALDVNDAIVQKTKNFGGSIPADSKFFTPFVWQMAPAIEDEDGSTDSEASAPKSLGYYMAPWIDQTSFKSYCLSSTHYNSDNALYKAMRDIIGVDTEGIYVGEKAAESISGTDGTIAGLKDLILIRETDLKAVWFYLSSGVPTAPTEDNVANHAVYFYYPLNKASPFVKTSTQRIYRVRSAQELNGSSGGSSSTSPDGSLSTFPPHDRKIGCVPKF